MRLAESAANGISLATGLPRFVITMPSGSTASSSARHRSLNFAAAIVFMVILYGWSSKVSIWPARETPPARHTRVLAVGSIVM